MLKQVYEIEGSDPSARPILLMEIGTRDNLTLEAARSAADDWNAMILATNPVALGFSIGGYDDDPRSLWEIPEVCRFVQWWAQLVGLDMRSASLTRWLDGGSAMAVLARCGAFGPTIMRYAIAGAPGPTPIHSSDAEPCEHKL